MLALPGVTALMQKPVKRVCTGSGAEDEAELTTDDEATDELATTELIVLEAALEIGALEETADEDGTGAAVLAAMLERGALDEAGLAEDSDDTMILDTALGATEELGSAEETEEGAELEGSRDEAIEALGNTEDTAEEGADKLTETDTEAIKELGNAEDADDIGAEMLDAALDAAEAELLGLQRLADATAARAVTTEAVKRMLQPKE